MSSAGTRNAGTNTSRAARLAVVLLTSAILVPVQLAVRPPMLLAERFLPNSGWLEIAALCLYAQWLLAKMAYPAKQPGFRLFSWTLFSAVFFTQLVLGLAGAERFLMTGKLHLPIPALIAAGPVYRGGGFFMVVLFSATILLVGPAWCSHLCYIGAWDALAAGTKRKPERVSPWLQSYGRVITLVVVIGTAALFRWAGVHRTTAVWAAGLFGIAGVSLMMFISRRKGTMVHCTTYCPMGLVAVLLGKLNPFRIKIDDSCTACGACSKACKYGALSKDHIAAKKPGLSCTLCGDCIGSCKFGSIGYRLAGLEPPVARTVFLVVVISLHASFLGLARI